MKTKVRIYKPTKNAMQSGRSGRAEKWVLEGVPATSKVPDHLMGWISAEDTDDQIRLTFDCKQTAISFADSKGWDYDVEDPHSRTVHPQSYMDNFGYRPVEYDKDTTGSHAGMGKKVKAKPEKAKKTVKSASKTSTKKKKSA